MGRLVITQKGRDLIRVIASISAYLVVACLALLTLIVILGSIHILAIFTGVIS